MPHEQCARGPISQTGPRQDRAKADLLLKLADESDRGILCTAEWLSARPYRKIEQPPNARDAKVRFEWDPHN